ncbi:MAG: proline--tRNA ligase [Alphaproteobacteria bacterium]|nr:proline--tRNA ligase [Alphaproteobacteria bacterium]
MYLSKFYLPILKENPAEAQITSHRLMLRAGMIRQTAAGIYTWLPLGLRVLKRVEEIVRLEQNKIGAHEVLMSTIQPAELWRESGRFDAYGPEMLKFQDRHDRTMLYGPTNEEQITDIFRQTVQTYRDLPQILYHIQWKFRDEVRPRFGVMRGREFLMKDAYSFDVDRDGAVHAYNKMFIAYLRTFQKLGLTAVPMRADTGPIGGDHSHEFLVLADTGESEVFFDQKYLDGLNVDDELDVHDRICLQNKIDDLTSAYAVTDEKYVEEEFFERVDPDNRVRGRGIEVGHIFYFGTKYSDPMNARVQEAQGQQVPVHMGSYGIGVSRLVGAIIEAHHDDQGIKWPSSVSPFDLGIINLKRDHAQTTKLVEALYQSACNQGLDPLVDDTDERAGGKFAKFDLIGLPHQIIVGPRLAENNQVEWKERQSGKRSEMSLDEAMNRLAELAVL